MIRDWETAMARFQFIDDSDEQYVCANGRRTYLVQRFKGIDVKLLAKGYQQHRQLMTPSLQIAVQDEDRRPAVPRSSGWLANIFHRLAML